LAYEIECVRPDRPKKTWKEVVNNCLKCLHWHASDTLNHKNEGN